MRARTYMSSWDIDLEFNGRAERVWEDLRLWGPQVAFNSTSFRYQLTVEAFMEAGLAHLATAPDCGWAT